MNENEQKNKLNYFENILDKLTIVASKICIWRICKGTASEIFCPLLEKKFIPTLCALLIAKRNHLGTNRSYNNFKKLLKLAVSK